MEINQKTKKLASSDQYELRSQIAMAKRKSGSDFIDLSVGQPSDPTPKNIKEFGIDAINKNEVFYTNSAGSDLFRSSCASYCSNVYKTEFKSNNVAASVGVKQAIFNALGSTLNKEDEVIVIAPTWPTYKDMVDFFDAKLVVVESNFAENFALPMDNLKRAVNQNTKWIILNYPSNPSGHTLSKKECMFIVSLMKKFPNILVMLDDIYKDIIYDGVFESPIHYADKDVIERFLITDGGSKGLRMTGWRIGFAASKSAELIKGISALNMISTSNATSISQYALAKFMEKPDDKELKIFVKSIKAKRDFCIEIMKELDVLNFKKPMSSMYLFCDVSGYFGKSYNGNRVSNSMDLTKYLIEDAMVGVMPGSMLFMEGFIRICFAVSENKIKDGLVRIAKSLKNLK